MLELRTLGSVDIRTTEGTALLSVLAQPKRAAVLIYLAAQPAGTFVQREKLLFVFWPDSDSEHARTLLRKALHYLRHSLGDDVLVARGDEGIGVSDTLLWCDCREFRGLAESGRYADALSLYRADFLDGFYVDGSVEFEQWSARERVRLRASAADCAARLADALAGEGKVADALASARRALELAEDDEVALRRVLLLLDRAGDRASALRLSEQFAERMRREFEMELSAETSALVKSLRSRSASASDGALPRTAMREAPVVELATATTASERDTTSEMAIAARAPGRRFALTAAAMLLFLSGTLALLAARRPRLNANRVVVAAFENRTGDRSLDPLGSMAADWVTQGVAQTGVVQVVDPTTALLETDEARAGAGSRASAEFVEKLAVRTGAGSVVLGSYYRQGDTLRFNAEIVNARSGEVVRAIDPVTGTIQAPVAAINVLRERVMGSLAMVLNPRLSANGNGAAQAPTYAAYLEYSEAVQYHARNDFANAMVHYERAHALDTTYIAPLVWAAHMHANLNEWSVADSLLPILARNAATLPPYDRYNLERLRARLAGDLSAIYRASHQMAEAAPGSDEARRHAANAAVRINRPAEALSILESLDPDSGWLKGWFGYWSSVTDALHMLGYHESELEKARAGRARNPTLLSTAFQEVRALAALGRGHDVDALLGESLTLPPQPRWSPGMLMLTASQELRAHGHADQRANVFRTASAWYASLPAAKQKKERYVYAEILYEAGQLESARALTLQLTHEDSTSTKYEGLLGALDARTGRRAEAVAILQHLGSLQQPYSFGTNALLQARIAAALGQNDNAVALLREAFSEGTIYDPWLHAYPEFDRLRGDPQFTKLLTPKG